MTFCTLNELKAHLRIDGNEEDTLLTTYADSAEAVLLNLLNRSVESIYIDHGCIPEPLRHAAMLLAAHFYAVREPVSTIAMATVPYTFDCLIKPYMIL